MTAPVRALACAARTAAVSVFLKQQAALLLLLLHTFFSVLRQNVEFVVMYKMRQAEVSEPSFFNLACRILERNIDYFRMI